MLRKKISIAIFLLFSIVTSYSQGSGYALDFDGVDDYVSVGNSTILRPTTNITIEAWVKPRTIGSWIAILGNLIDNGSNENGYGFVSNA
ncbi:MAG: LamG-like jellyroll fold domain-containing protein, partial [Flavobacteriales bacterium]